jgi:hypothetical protein
MARSVLVCWVVGFIFAGSMSVAAETNCDKILSVVAEDIKRAPASQRVSLLKSKFRDMGSCGSGQTARHCIKCYLKTGEQKFVYVAIDRNFGKIHTYISRFCPCDNY